MLAVPVTTLGGMFAVEPKTAVAAVSLVVLWGVEWLLPFYSAPGGGLRDRLRHDARNVVLGLANPALLVLLFGGVFVAVESWAEAHGVGLLRVLDWPGWVELGLVLVLFDAWMYVWHRANHRFAFLWRFHRMHHSDARMDVTTALRFHPGEQLLAALSRMAVLPLLGLELWQLAVYEAVLLPVILFHHSNVAFPRWLDHGLLALIVTPAMHRVHHSRLQPETDSNYGSVLPYWDLLFRSFRLREDARTIELGLDDFDADEWQTLPGLLRTPLRSGTHDEPASD